MVKTSRDLLENICRENLKFSFKFPVRRSGKCVRIFGKSGGKFKNGFVVGKLGGFLLNSSTTLEIYLIMIRFLGAKSFNDKKCEPLDLPRRRIRKEKFMFEAMKSRR